MGAGESERALEGDPCGDGKVLCLHCISVGILAVILYYCFAECYDGEN